MGSIDENNVTLTSSTGNLDRSLTPEAVTNFVFNYATPPRSSPEHQAISAPINHGYQQPNQWTTGQEGYQGQTVIVENQGQYLTNTDTDFFHDPKAPWAEDQVQGQPQMMANDQVFEQQPVYYASWENQQQAQPQPMIPNGQAFEQQYWVNQQQVVPQQQQVQAQQMLPMGQVYQVPGYQAHPGYQAQGYQVQGYQVFEQQPQQQIIPNGFQAQQPALMPMMIAGGENKENQAPIKKTKSAAHIRFNIKASDEFVFQHEARELRISLKNQKIVTFLKSQKISSIILYILETLLGNLNEYSKSGNRYKKNDDGRVVKSGGKKPVPKDLIKEIYDFVRAICTENQTGKSLDSYTGGLISKACSRVPDRENKAARRRL